MARYDLLCVSRQYLESFFSLLCMELKPTSSAMHGWLYSFILYMQSCQDRSYLADLKIPGALLDIATLMETSYFMGFMILLISDRQRSL